ncbi:hypothetical protein L484_011170 [Morus notabilis]|uniref:Uncharacterized protein n=1 Tax=Morus notabilis TaxID=981085 RepID=W9QV08_9ROSA|nr:hypothetical protein L484_011170 [Morus notabilis]
MADDVLRIRHGEISFSANSSDQIAAMTMRRRRCRDANQILDRVAPRTATQPRYGPFDGRYVRMDSGSVEFHSLIRIRCEQRTNPDRREALPTKDRTTLAAKTRSPFCKPDAVVNNIRGKVVVNQL